MLKKIINWKIILLSFLNAASSIFYLFFAIMFYYISNSIIKQDWNSAIIFTSVLASTWVFVSLSAIYMYRKTVLVLNNAIYKSFFSLESKFLNWNYSDYSKNNEGHYFSLIRNNYEQEVKNLIQNFTILLEKVLLIVSALISTLVLNWIMGLVLLGSVSIIILWPKILEKLFVKRKNLIQTQLSLFLDKTTDILNKFSVLYFSKNKNKIYEEITSEQKKLIKLNIAQNNLKNSVDSINNFLKSFFSLSLKILSILFTAFNIENSSIGLIFYFSIVVGQVLENSELIPRNYLNFKQNLNIIKKVEKFNDDSLFLENKLKNYDEKFQKLVVKNLKFSYGDKNVFQNLNFDFEKGKKYIILGKNGVGKSTLIKLLTGLEREYQGEVLLNNQQIKEVKQKSLANYFNYVSNESFLFNESLKNNLTLFNENITEEQLKKVLAETSLTEAISDLNLVYDESQQDFSVGQKQRIDLARSLLQPKDVLILDEALSNLDKENANKIIDKFLSNKDQTLIYITHHFTKDLGAKFDHIYQL